MFICLFFCRQVVTKPAIAIRLFCGFFRFVFLRFLGFFFLISKSMSESGRRESNACKF